jgi:hypothetical protein
LPVYWVVFRLSTRATAPQSGQRAWLNLDLAGTLGSFHATTVEIAFIRRVLLDIGGLALLGNV